MLITVFTPTFNRSHTIERTFQSLCKQQFKDFEWLVVDDGSTDGTESLVHTFASKADFPVRYIRKANGGKHTAHNVAIQEAAGKLFFTVDSDDWLTDNSLSDISRMSAELFSNDRLAGIIALKELPDGKVLGPSFPQGLTESSLVDLERKKLSGERSLVFKTDIIRQFPFPVIEGERFIGESVVYDRIGAKYDFMVSNAVLTTCEYQLDGLSSSPQTLMVKNPCGYAIYYAQRIDAAPGFNARIGMIFRHLAFRHLTPCENRKHARYEGRHKMLVRTLYPAGIAVAYFYKFKTAR